MFHKKQRPLAASYAANGGVISILSGKSAAARKTEADGNGIVHHSHLLFVQMPHVFPQSALVDGADLFQQDNGILAEPNAASGYIDMGWQAGLACLAGNGSSDHCG